MVRGRLPKAPKRSRAQCGQTQQLFSLRTGQEQQGIRLQGTWQVLRISSVLILIRILSTRHQQSFHLRPPNKRSPRRLPPVSPRFALCIVKSISSRRRHPWALTGLRPPIIPLPGARVSFCLSTSVPTTTNLTSLFFAVLGIFFAFCPSLATLLRRLCQPLNKGPRGG